MRYVSTFAALALWLLGASPSVFAQSRGEIQVPQKGVDIRPAAAPSMPDEPKTLVLSLDAERVKGDKSASVALVDFTDYQ